MDTKMPDAEALAVLEEVLSWINPQDLQQRGRTALAHLTSRLVAGEVDWRLKHTEKVPLPPDPEEVEWAGRGIRIPPPIRYETVYCWEARVTCKTKTDKPPVAAPPAHPQAVGEAVAMPGTSGFTMVCFKAAEVPVGTKLYAEPTAQQEKDK